MCSVLTCARRAYRPFATAEGVLVTKKDTQIQFEGIPEIPNLEVMMLMKSLTSREYVRETFSWQYLYYYLTEEGINYLREYLALPASVAPQTKTAPVSQRPAGTCERMPCVVCLGVSVMHLAWFCCR